MNGLPNADTYGVVLYNAKGEVLLREPTGRFGGYAWTFAKGRPDPGETPAQTAKREAIYETGYAVELLAVIPEVFSGTTSSAAFYLAGPTGSQGAFSPETSATQWASPEAAAALIRKSPNAKGRNRDLRILGASQAVWDRLSPPDRPATCKEDWLTLEPNEDSVEIALDLTFDEAAMARIRKGYLPVAMEEKWFIWFEAPFLYLHRSWTGFCLFKVLFREGPAGWQAVSALANRDPEQYLETDDDADRRLIETLIDGWLVHRPDPS